MAPEARGDLTFNEMQNSIPTTPVPVGLSGNLLVRITSTSAFFQSIRASRPLSAKASHIKGKPLLPDYRFPLGWKRT